MDETSNNRKVAEEADDLKRILSSPILSDETVFLILERHSNCFVANLCSICEYLEERGEDLILSQLAENPSISKAVQSRILEESFKWQGIEVGIKLSLVGNPGLDAEIRSTLLMPDIWYGYGYGNDLISELIEAASENPNFPIDEIEAFIKECVEFYGYDEAE